MFCSLLHCRLSITVGEETWLFHPSCKAYVSAELIRWPDHKWGQGPWIWPAAAAPRKQCHCWGIASHDGWGWRTLRTLNSCKVLWTEYLWQRHHGLGCILLCVCVCVCALLVTPAWWTLTVWVQHLSWKGYQHTLTKTLQDLQSAIKWTDRPCGKMMESTIENDIYF